MNVNDASSTEPDVFHSTWVLLDEASQVLLRAESIVVLLGIESDAAQSHAYAADVAGDLLGTLKEKLAQAQEMVGPLRRRRSPRTVKSR